MRVRIARPLSGVMNGVSLSSLLPGLVYDLDSEVAAQLIEMRDATAVFDADGPAVEPLEEMEAAWLTGGIHVLQPDSAPDRKRGRRRYRQ